MKFIRDIIKEQKKSNVADGIPDPSFAPEMATAPFEDKLEELGPLELQSSHAAPLVDEMQNGADSALAAASEEIEIAGFDDLEVEDDTSDTQSAAPSDPFGNLYSEHSPDISPLAEEPEIDSDDAFIAGLEKFAETASPVSTDPACAAATETAETQAAPPSDTGHPSEPTEVLQSNLTEAMRAPVEADPDPIVIPVEVPKPAEGRATGRSGRVKTRLLGFSSADASAFVPFAKTDEASEPGFTSFPVGWLVVTEGLGKGAAFTLYDGLTQIGRGEGQTVRINFGDNSISRENHAAIAFDAEQQKFYFGHGGKANLVRLNNRPVLSTEELPTDSQIRIGETTLRFVALCGADFNWGEDEQKVAVNNVAG